MKREKSGDRQTHTDTHRHRRHPPIVNYSPRRNLFRRGQKQTKKQTIVPNHHQLALTLALMLVKSCGPMVSGCGFSTSLRSPRVANSSVTFCSVSAVWLTTSTSNTMSYWRQRTNQEKKYFAYKQLLLTSQLKALLHSSRWLFTSLIYVVVVVVVLTNRLQRKRGRRSQCAA